MAGNMSEDLSGEDLSTEENNDNKFIEIVSGFLLNPEIGDVFTLDEMRSNFSSKYRAHDDITVLYEAFVKKRKLIKDTVRKNIEEFYTREKTKHSNKHEQSMEEKLAVLDGKQRQLKRELSKAKKELSVLQKNITRCDEAVRDCYLLKKDVKEYFNMDLFKELDERL